MRGRRYGPCPEGMSLTIVLAFLCTFAGPAVLALGLRGSGGKVRGVVAAVLCATLALPVGWQGFRSVLGPSAVRPVWSAPVDRPADSRARAVWQDGETVVRARGDRLDAYRAQDGTVAWSLPAPTRQSLCAASPDSVDGVAVVGHGRSGGPCERLSAVDLRTGRELWHREGVQPRVLAPAGPLLVVLDGERLSAFALRDGAPAWSASPTEGCRIRSLRAVAARVMVVEYCPAPGGDARLGRTWARAYDASGRDLWRTDLGAETEPARAELLLTDLPVVRLAESDDRGVDAVIALGADGALRATVPIGAADLDLTGLARGEARRFTLVPVGRFTVVGDLLVVAAKRPGDSAARDVVAHSLTDGSRRWTRRLPGKVAAIAGTPDGPLVVVDHGLETVYRLDPATGGEAERTAGRSTDFAAGFWLGRTDTRYVVVHEDGTRLFAPAIGIPRR